MLKTRAAAPIPRGDSKFERQRCEALRQFAAKVPHDLILSPSVIDSRDQDVTRIPASCGLLTSKELDITENYTLVALAGAMATRKLTALAVTSAFCKRAIIAHQLTFCLSDVFMDEAIQQARRLDDHLARTGRTVGPLHGIPISVKEMIPVAGHLCSFGMAITRHTAKEDCLLIEILRELGAVFYVKTHQPTGVLSMETTSFLGRTLNPHNTSLSAGGSSGGEAALIAMKGSIIGIGADIGGSIRLPAMSCGVYGLKGSTGFMPGASILNGPFDPGLNLDGIFGVLGRHLNDIDYIITHVKTQKLYLRDPDALPIPWHGLSSAKPEGGLKIGVMASDGVMQTQPPISRALQWACDQLAAEGFEIFPFKFYKPREAYQMYFKLLMPDGGSTYRAGLSAGHEPEFPSLERIITAALTADPQVEVGTEEPATLIAQRRHDRDIFRAGFLADWIEQGDPDIVIMPASFGPAVAHDTGDYFNHTSVWNVVDYPAITLPTKFKAEAREQYDRREYEDLAVLGDHDLEARKLWRHNSYEGAPVCLQVVAKRHMENDLFAALGQIRGALNLT